MTPEAVRAVAVDVFHRLAPEADFDTIDPDDDLREQLDIDSMDYLNALITLDERTGVEVPESDYGEVDTLSKLVDYIARRSV
ncbi:MAG: acyl carrier protein [Dehalococcoidia bacterium]